jgi:hypothetical protein
LLLIAAITSRITHVPLNNRPIIQRCNNPRKLQRPVNNFNCLFGIIKQLRLSALNRWISKIVNPTRSWDFYCARKKNFRTFLSTNILFFMRREAKNCFPSFKCFFQLQCKIKIFLSARALKYFFPQKNPRPPSPPPDKKMVVA